jgi:hypothetical protein
VAYAGTVSHWLDFESLISCLNAFTELEIHLIGPRLVQVPAHPRLISLRQVAYTELRAKLSPYDGFILPFLLGDLTLGVDPVKLYEYLACGRPTLSIYYPELEQFRDLVSFYQDASTLQQVVGRLFSDPASLCPDPVRTKAFLADARWEQRTVAIAGEIARVGEQPVP